MPKLPYFPFNPWEYLLDEKIDSLSSEEEGLNLRLWCYEWINKVKRGHLLYDKNTPLSNEQIAKKLRINPEKFEKLREKLLKLGLHKVGRKKEVYSPRLSKYKTKYELYERRSETYRKPIRNRSDYTLPNHTLPNKKDASKEAQSGKEKISHLGEKIFKPMQPDPKSVDWDSPFKVWGFYHPEEKNPFPYVQSLIQDLRKVFDLDTARKKLALFMKEVCEDPKALDHKAVLETRCKAPGDYLRDAK